MIKNYIFDFGNVLGEFSPDKLTKVYVPDEKTRAHIRDVVFDRIYWDKLDEGVITDEEVKKDICTRLPAELHEVACKVFDDWTYNMTPVKGMEQLIFDIKKTDKKLYLLSNIGKPFIENHRSVKWIKELFDCFDGLVMSGSIKKVKPNKDVFEYLLKKFDLTAEECLFIDDNENNIEGAKCVGIDGYLFDGDADKLRKYLCL